MKRLLPILILIVLAGESNAQMRIGIKQGLNLSTINYSPWYDQYQYNIKFDYRKAYCGGLVFQYFSEKKLGIQAELLFSQKGFDTQYDTIRNTQYKRSINYISLPMLMHFYFFQKSTSPFILLGVYGSMALNSKEIYIDNHAVTKTLNYQYDRNRDNRGEYGLDVGFGFRRIFSFGTLQAQGEFNYSFGSLYKWGTRSDNTELNNYFRIPEVAENQAITISLTYLIDLKKKTFVK